MDTIEIPLVVETVTARRAAQIIGVTRQTIARWIEQGRFPGTRKNEGADWAIPVGAVYKIAQERGAMLTDDRQVMEALNKVYLEAIADVSTAAAQLTDRNRACLEAARAAHEAGQIPVEVVNNFRAALETLMGVTKRLIDIDTMRSGVIALSVESQDHPEDQGPVRP